MTEIQCPYCQANVSSTVRTCPKCRKPLKDDRFWTVIFVYSAMIVSSLAVSILIDPIDGTIALMIGCVIFTSLIVQKLA